MGLKPLTHNPIGPKHETLNFKPCALSPKPRTLNQNNIPGVEACRREIQLEVEGFSAGLGLRVKEFKR